jgi:hypothetical protein
MTCRLLKGMVVTAAGAEGVKRVALAKPVKAQGLVSVSLTIPNICGT